ncbi:hypothetical protein BN2537_2299 [Streptomyces venezuelae]|nr:hypothetical protein BN2537_2299 [Streptomyces venezuelae]
MHAAILATASCLPRSGGWGQGSRAPVGWVGPGGVPLPRAAPPGVARGV